jgi:hypothetical protein
MSPRYPSLAFNARDTQDLIEEVNKHSKGVEIGIKQAATKRDPARLRVLAVCVRRGFEIGTSPTARAEVLVPGQGQQSLDKAIADALWKLLQELEAPVTLWGRYTSLVD